MSLDPDLEEMRRRGYLAVDRGVEHLAGLDGQRVARRVAADDMQALVGEPLPRAGAGLEDCLDRYFGTLLPAATLVNHPRFFAYIPGPGSFAGAIGAWAAAATNLFVGTWLGGAVMNQLELQVLEWLRQALDLPEATSGILTTGGSMANLGALAAARSRCDAPGRAVIYSSTEAHYSISKAALTLGIPRAQVREIEADEAGRLRPDILAAMIAADRAAGLAPAAICATAGTTNTGAIDPLAILADLATRERIWLHVDAAYGGAAAMLPESRRTFDGLTRADSITLDPHKWLYTPFECGCLLTRHVDALRAAFTADGGYLQDVPRDEVNFFERGPELSRGNRGAVLWFVLRALGLDAICTAIREDLRLCRLAHDLLACDPRLEIVTEPRLSVFTFAVTSGDDDSRKLVERLLEDGTVMLSSTRVLERFVLRFCVVNHRTTEADIHRAAASIRDTVGAICSGQ